MIKLDFPRVSLCHRPTPLEPMPRLSEHLGGPALYVKRDDCTGLAGGGNKTRKLEFLAAAALEQGADTLVTTGGVQSNHARQTAAAAARLGLKCQLVLPQVVPRDDELYQHNGNVLLDGLLGAELHIVESREAAQARIAELTESKRAYYIPTGGSTPVGALGYVDAARECLDQCRTQGIEPTQHVLVTGSGGTHAGVLAGLLASGCDQPVIGLSVAHSAQEASKTVCSLVAETAELLGSKVTGIEGHVDVRDEWIGPGYGIPTDAMREAVGLTARLEGILLDPVYTGKAMAGLIHLVRSGELGPDNRIVFWHTGGSPALFAYQGDLA